VIGGGGKTTLIRVLAKELCEKDRVIIVSTAKIWPPDWVQTLYTPGEKALAAHMLSHGVACVGDTCEKGKLTLDKTPLSMLLRHAAYVLVEADGSKGLPLKAHAAFEPVIPPETRRTILVLGLDGIGRPIREAAHRPVLYAGLLHTDTAHAVSPEDAAAVIELEGYGDMVFLNKAEGDAREAAAKQIAARLTRFAAMGSLYTRGEEICLLS
jgi:probable selenium-dependent hydroxylase accessory protein YqeC